MISLEGYALSKRIIHLLAVKTIMSLLRNDVTIVCSFNIEERMDGRDWDEYLEWFDVTLN